MSVKFKGRMNFKQELTASQLAYLNQFLGEDMRDHHGWEKYRDKGTFYHIDLRLTDDFSGIEHNKVEKTYELAEQINLLLNAMREKWPEFGLKGRIVGQSTHDVGDIWEIVIENGQAKRNKLHIEGLVKCPNCGQVFKAQSATINQNVGTVESGSTFTGVKIDRLG